ncbi:MAG: SagB/ThcOx family dehydrogenase [Endomicrobia bacterium]|nr:SagB/ThcOx family dehydrogenase [Endomicrobiia bacterium]
MNKYFIFYIFFLLSIGYTKEFRLPKPSYKGNVSLEEILYKWKATRRFRPDLGISLQQLSQLLWSCNGITADGLSSATRTFPSAGAIYPLEVYIVCENIKGINNGIYRYNHINHSLELLKNGNFRDQLAKAALNQFFISQAPVSFIWVAEYDKTSWYGERGRVRYIHIDLGHSAQNLTLQATALGLGTVQIGAFNDAAVRTLLGLPENKTPVYIMPVGYKH